MAVSTGMFNILTVSFSFMVLFCAYNTYQNYATSILPGDLGRQSLAVLYASIAVTVFVAPSMVNRFGPRRTLIIGSVMYVGYMASLIKIVNAVVLVMSVVIGFGAAILWVALGVYVTQNSERTTYGRNTGIFWSIFQFSQVIGNLITYFAFPHVSSDTDLFIGFTVVGAAGVAGLFLLRKPPHVLDFSILNSADIENTHDSDNNTGFSSFSMASALRSLIGSVRHALGHLTDPRMCLLVPLMVFSGAELSFWSGEFTEMIPDTSIGLVLAFVGVGEVIGGLAMGRLSDKVSRSASLLVGAVVYSVGLALSAFMKSADCLANNCIGPTLGEVPFGAYAAALCFGVGDSTFNTNLYATLADMYHTPEEALLELNESEKEGLQGLLDSPEPRKPRITDGAHSAGAFTIFQFIQNVGTAFGFFYALGCPMHGADGTLTQVWVQTALIVTGTCCFIVLRYLLWRNHGAPSI